MLNASGKLKVDIKRQRITVDLNRDFTDYYIWFLERKHWIRFNSPRFGTHITVINRQYHKSNINWWVLRNRYDGSTIDFEYDHNLIRGGFKKGFIMYYMEIHSSKLEDIKREAGITEDRNFKGLHITIGTAGKSGAKIVDYWPNTITIAH